MSKEVQLTAAMKANAEKAFNTHKNLNGAYVTTDGQVFPTEHLAYEHSKEVGDRKVAHVTREELAGKSKSEKTSAAPQGREAELLAMTGNELKALHGDKVDLKGITNKAGMVAKILEYEKANV